VIVIRNINRNGEIVHTLKELIWKYYIYVSLGGLRNGTSQPNIHRVQDYPRSWRKGRDVKQLFPNLIVRMEQWFKW
jgi:hypothetical protein